MSENTTVLPQEPEGPDGSGGGSRKRTAVIGVTSAAVVAVLAVGAYGYVKLSGGGPQPAEVLPASTLGYASFDLDPSAGQKIEAVKMLRKFPALKKQVKADADLRRTIFDKAIEDSDCDLTYDRDIKPWIGERFAVAGVEVDDAPQGVFVVQVKDDDKAEKGLKKVLDCAVDDGEGAVALKDGYAVVAETQSIADTVVKEGQSKSLADDSDYQHWGDEVGDRGIVNFYASKDGAKVLMKEVAKQGSADPSLDAASESLDKFKGFAGTVRFADNGLELSTAAGTDTSVSNKDPEALDLAESLPKDTGLALSLSFGDDTIDKFFDSFAKSTEFESAIKQAEAEFGLSLPADAKTLLGKGLALAVSGDLPKLDEVSSPSDLKAGLKIEGDASDIKGVVAKLEKAAGGSLEQLGLVQDQDDDHYVLATNDDYGQQLLDAEGDLEDNPSFKDVIADVDDANSVFFLDFNGNWFDRVRDLVSQMGAPAEVMEGIDNVGVLKAIGMTSWLDGDTGRAQFRIALD